MCCGLSKIDRPMNQGIFNLIMAFISPWLYPNFCLNFTKKTFFVDYHWLVFWNITLGIIIPTDKLIFFRGVVLPPTRSKVDHEILLIFILSLWGLAGTRTLPPATDLATGECGQNDGLAEWWIHQGGHFSHVFIDFYWILCNVWRNVWHFICIL